MNVNRMDRSLRRYTLAGLTGVFLVVGGLGAWAGMAEINGAVIAPGQLVVEGELRHVQHREGGVVNKIHVRNGDRVENGQPLIELDTLDLSTELKLVAQQRLEWMARRSRLLAQRDELPEIEFPEELRQSQIPEIRELIRAQKRIFSVQKAGLESRSAQLNERIKQLEEEIKGLEAQQIANDKQYKIAIDDQADVEGLLKKGLVQKPRVLQVRNSVAQLEGVAGQIVAAMARSQGRIAEIRLQILQLREDVMRQALDELREADSKYQELSDRANTISEKIERAVVTAPSSGVVHEMTVFNEGAVVAPGQKILEIVPQDEALIVEANVRPQDIDQVSEGQPVDLVFENANQRITPRLIGKVKSVSAYLRRTDGQVPPFYSVRLIADEEEMDKLDELALRPGMQVTAFIRTEARTPLSFLTKPGYELWNRMFRER